MLAAGKWRHGLRLTPRGNARDTQPRPETTADVEVVVVNDGSKDDTLENLITGFQLCRYLEASRKQGRANRIANGCTLRDDFLGGALFGLIAWPDAAVFVLPALSPGMLLSTCAIILEEFTFPTYRKLGELALPYAAA